MPWRDKRNGFLHWIFRRWFPAPSTRGPLPQPQVSPEDARRAKLAEFQSALGITYDVAIIIAGNFPLPGLQSVIGLVDYVKGLRQVMSNKCILRTVHPDQADDILYQGKDRK